jgi:aspartate aminotransferase
LTTKTRNIRFSPRVENIQVSPTLQVLNRATELIASGVDIVDFGPGEPDFRTPVCAAEAGKRAIDEGFTRYTNASGTNELREAIGRHYAGRYNIELDRRNVIVGTGGKQELFNAMLALVDEGDEVIIPSPYWVSFPDQVTFAGGVPVFVDALTEAHFRPTFSLIERAVSPKTRGVILNSPCNPTGAVIREEELEKIIRFCADNDLFLIFDETYEFFVYGEEKHVSAAKYLAEFPETIIIVNSFSKTYAMTGWRLGFAIAHPDTIAAFGKIQSHSTTNPSSISQYAALEALRSGGPEVQKMYDAYVERRAWLVPALNNIPDLTCDTPDGAFYVFPNVSGFYGRGEVRDSTTLARYLLDQARVAVVPGCAFGADQYVRLSYATSLENIEKGVARIAEALGALR